MKTLLTILLLTMASLAQQITPFSKMYDEPRIQDKKIIWMGLSDMERADARCENFAWGVRKLKLTPSQVEYLVRFCSALPVTQAQGRIWEQESLTLFPKEKAELLFGSIGPFISTCPQIFVKASMGNCPCSIGSSFNMSCDKPCGGAGGQCTVTPDGCGFAWLFSCDGYCQTGYMPEDPPQG
jgi:hypothetical protein